MGPRPFNRTQGTSPVGRLTHCACGMRSWRERGRQTNVDPDGVGNRIPDDPPAMQAQIGAPLFALQ